MDKVNTPVLTKFDGGGGGVGIYALEPGEPGFRCNGEVVDAAWIWSKYEQNMERGFIVEKRVYNHPLMAKQHPGSFNTLRLSTIKTADGQFHLAQPFLKIGRHNSPVDNLSAGGLFAGVDGTLA